MNSWRDPVAQRWLLGGEVAAIRESARMSLADVAAVTEISKPKLGQLERGTYNVGPDELELILVACHASNTDIARLKAYATRPRGRSWWAPWSSVVPDWFGLYLGLEGMAASLFVYETAAVHGLLQTAEYARAVTSVASMVRPADVDQHVELRLQRAKRLEADGPLFYQLVLEEAALRRVPPSREVMKAQLEHLLVTTDRPNVEIRILPVDRKLHAGMTAGQFVMFDFPDLGSVAHAEAFGDATYTRDIDRLRSYRDAARHLSDAALSTAETIDVITQMRKRL